GVGCDHCHVEERGKPPAMDKDDKQPKRTARKMIVMMQKINHDFFGGDQVVTCATCHNGRAEPRSVPPLEHVAAEKREGEGEAKPPAVTVQQLLDKWVQASGGAAAWGKLHTRHGKGSVAGFGPQPFGVEVVQAPPDKQRFTLTMPNGVFEQAWDGKSGWRAFGGRVRPLDDVEEARREAQFAPPLTLAKLLTGLKVLPDAPLGKGTAHVIEGRQGEARVRLWLDAQTGLLARMSVRVPTPVGDLPAEVDYSDYRVVDGVKLPFVETSHVGGETRTQTWSEIKHNMPIAADAFAPPKTSAPPKAPQGK
ncbi:MAG TPA: photosynthetic reaction center cytochrome c subunit family protein, partial [Polyangia bacterium]